ncbi:MotA/TolQ/ExbB proton channel family protein [Myxococcota bacterium]|nr:MotA/TolQ/ExbB proton channel family protein [Myxococcota bacterium]
MVALSLLGATWVLWLLVALSVLSVAVMIERALFYVRRKVDPYRLHDQLAAALDKKDVAAAKALLTGADTMEAHVLGAGLATIHRGPRVVSETMEAELLRQKSRFEAYLIFLGTLGNNAPFIGLFGTVLGIIKAFKDLSLGDPSKGGAGAQAVMAGISEALVATAVGLAVALPAVVAFNYFKTVVKRTVVNTEALTRTLNAHIEALEEK